MAVETYIRRNELLARIPLSSQTIDRFVAEGGFPAPFRIGTRAVAWKESEIEAWLDSRRVERVHSDVDEVAPA